MYKHVDHCLEYLHNAPPHIVRSIEGHLRLTSIIRYKLRDSADSPGHNLVNNIKRSHEEWRASDRFKRGIRYVWEWRQAHGKRIGDRGHPLATEEDALEGDLPIVAHVRALIAFKSDTSGEPFLGHDLDHNDLDGPFPNQNMGLSNLLDEPYDRVKPILGVRRDEIWYIHLPANNLEVSNSDLPPLP